MCSISIACKSELFLRLLLFLLCLDAHRDIAGQWFRWPECYSVELDQKEALTGLRQWSPWQCVSGSAYIFFCTLNPRQDSINLKYLCSIREWEGISWFIVTVFSSYIKILTLVLRYSVMCMFRQEKGVIQYSWVA